MKRVDGRSVPRGALEHYRFQALELRKKGWKETKIAEAFGLHEKNISRWFVKKNKYGEKSLKSTKAKGKKPKISIEEWKQIISWMKEDATTYGFETPLWTSKRVKNLIKIKSLIRRQQAVLYFQDEAGISLIPVLGRTWAPIGKTPTVKVTGKRGGFCVSSAISPGGRMLFRIEKKKVNAQAHIDFLSKIILHHPKRKIVIISDNAPAHKAKLVREFEISNKKRITIFHIPSYSPDLNPDEHVWAYLKAHKLVAHQAQNTDELKDLVKRKMQSIQKSSNLINSFFMQNKVTKL